MQPTKFTPKPGYLGRRRLRNLKLSAPNFSYTCYSCKVPYQLMIQRGTFKGIEAYVSDEGRVYRREDSVFICYDTDPAYIEFLPDGPPIAIDLILTYLDGDESNERDDNLRFLCQLCHARQTAVIRTLRRQLKAIQDPKDIKQISENVEADPAQLLLFEIKENTVTNGKG